MYVINVIPLVALPRNQAQILSYFYIKSLPSGTVVEIPLRNKKIRGIVFNSKPLSSQKLALKKLSDFETKKINKVIFKKPILSKSQIDIALWLSSYYYSPLSLALKNVLPPFWNIKKYNIQILEDKKKTRHERELKTEYIPTKNLQTHYKEYESHIKKYTKKGQVLLLVPDIVMADYFMKNYKDFNPIQLHGNISNSNYYELWQKIQSGSPVFIIGTRISLFLPFQNLKLIIVDDEPNEMYRSDMTPKYNAATLAKKVSALHGTNLIINALVPTLDVYNKSRPSWFKYRPRFNTRIADMVSEIKNVNFSIFSKDLQDTILTYAAKKQNIILFVPRRGYSLSIICKKCGVTTTCQNCNVSMVIHEREGGKKLICHHCQAEQEIPKLCPNCNSYKIKLYGVGIEKVINEINMFFEKKRITPPAIYRLDSDVIKNNQQKREVFKKFQESKGGILVATQMIFSFKYNTLNQLKGLLHTRFIGIISMDSLAGFTDFKTEERLFRTLTTLGSMTKNILIQTYNPEDISAQAVIDKSGKNFFDNELKLRKDLFYPPFSQLVKITYGNISPRKAKYEAVVLAEKLRTLLSQDPRKAQQDIRYEILGPVPGIVEKKKGKYVWNIVLKIKKQETDSREQITKKRNELLRIVPSRDWQVEIDPVNLL